MSNPSDPQAELRKIEAALSALAAVLAGEALKIAQQPLLERKAAILQGSGALAQGNGNTAVGAGGVNVGGSVDGDVVTGIKITVGETDADPADLRRAYLNHLLETVGKLSLTGIDPKAASEAQSQISLSAIYTALLTFSADLPSPASEREARGENRRLSALEQLNQHPRLVLLGDPGSGKSTFVSFVALCQAGEALGNENANLKRLTAPLPTEEGERQSRDEKPLPQPWDHGALLPVRVVLRDFAARGLPPSAQKATARHLWDFIVTDLKEAALEAFERPLTSELLKKGGLLLLDGLDEVPEAEQRRAQIKQAIEDFAAAFPKCRVLVTSRTYAYQKQDWRLNGFQETVLAPFSAGQIRQFVKSWYAHIALLRNLNPQDAEGRAELLKKAIFSSNRLRGLAERPLLLTLMASLHAWRGGTLPEKREELYADTVELLLDWWENQRVVRDGMGKVIMIQPSLAEWLKLDRQKVRNLLNELAFRAHSAQPDLQGTADVAESDLVTGLMHLSDADIAQIRLVEYLRDRAGLLIPRGVGVYTFPHRTFQEYLAACYLTDHDYPDQIAALACADFNRWREVALLAGAKAGRGTTSAIWSLVDALCYADIQPDCNETALWGAHLAGQVLAEAVNVETVNERNRPKLGRVRQGLVQVLQTGRLPAVERARAGDTLAKLGDPRREVTSCEAMAFCHVPGGDFLYGDDKKKTRLDAFWIGKYPVTNAQFAQFVAAKGYQNPTCWPEAIEAQYWTGQGFKGRWDDNPRLAPVDYGEPFTLPNHPVVGISWFEALAFCHWLEERFKEIRAKGLAEKGILDREMWSGLANGKLQVMLPSEAEWEKAARGVDGRGYPWEGDFDADKANTEETGIGATSAVGCFPGGQSPFGLLDASGNVWEWAMGGDSAARVLRGGSCFSDARFARCACRYGDFPDFWFWYCGFRVVLAPLSL